MSTKAQRLARTEERGLLNEDLHPPTETAGVRPESTVWAALVADRGGVNPFTGKEFRRLVASGAAGIPALRGPWPTSGPMEWREAAGLTTLDVANVMQVPAELVEAWEAGGEPFAGNWLGADGLDDLSARRLYGAFRGYAEGGPYPERPAPEPAPMRPPVEIIGGEDYPRREVLEAAALPYGVRPSKLAGEPAFVRVVVRGDQPGIPALRAIPSGDDLRSLREAMGWSAERLGAYLGAAASRVESWERGETLPGGDCDGGLSAALRLYGVLAVTRDLREAEAADVNGAA